MDRFSLLLLEPGEIYFEDPGEAFRGLLRWGGSELVRTEGGWRKGARGKANGAWGAIRNISTAMQNEERYWGGESGAAPNGAPKAGRFQGLAGLCMGRGRRGVGIAIVPRDVSRALAFNV